MTNCRILAIWGTGTPPSSKQLNNFSPSNPLFLCFILKGIDSRSAGIFLGTSQLAYGRQKLGRSPSPARGSGGMLPREIFEKSDAIICIFVYFEGHTYPLDGYILMKEVYALNLKAIYL